MILNPNIYKDALDKRKDTILRGILGAPKFDILTLYSLGAHIPIVAVLCYALRPDVGGPNVDIQRVLEANLDCYKYESVTPWTDLP